MTNKDLPSSQNCDGPNRQARFQKNVPTKPKRVQGTNGGGSLGGGLLLDDFLNQIAFSSRHYCVDLAALDLKKLESYPGARPALAELIRDTLRHGGEAYAAKNPLLDPLGPGIYGTPLSEQVPWRFRISAGSVEPVLRRVFELGAGTVALLPTRDEPEFNAKGLKALARSLSKVSQKLETGCQRPGLRERIDLIAQRESGRKPELWGLAVDVGIAADMLTAAAKLKVTRVPMGSPNPQVRFAMYFADFFYVRTGRRHYEPLKTLLAAASHAVGAGTTPKWVDRLEVEMTLHRAKRKRWFDHIAVSPSGRSS